MREKVIKHIQQSKVIAIVRGLDPTQMLALMKAFIRGGITLAELAFDQKNPDSWKQTCACIRLLSEHFDSTVDIGAGTVLTIEQAEMAKQAGAKYIVSPDVNPEIIRYTRENEMVSLPGCMTPTEITSALSAGADFIKLFPAEMLGISYIKAIRAPLRHAKMLAVGGVNDQNAADFIKAGCVGVGVGGNLVNKEWIANREFERIAALATRYVEAVKG